MPEQEDRDPDDTAASVEADADLNAPPNADPATGGTPTTTWCPRCQATGIPPTGPCPSCGLPQDASDVERLRAITWELFDLDEQLRELATRRRLLGSEQAALATALRASVATPRSHVPSAPRPNTGAEWRTDVVRNLLLWVGGVLLAAAALIFAAFAWTRLDDGGRAALLAGVTVAAAGGAAYLRTRLPATAEVLATLALALVLTDWLALRRAGVADDWDPASWWALGTAVTAALAAAAGSHLRAPRAVMAVSAQAAALLAFSTSDAGDVASGAVLAVIAGAAAAAGCACGRVEGWRVSGSLFRTGAAIVDLIAAPTLVIALADGGPTWGAAGAVALLGLAPLAPLAARGDGPTANASVLAGLAAAALLGALAVIEWIAVSPPMLWALLAASAAAALAVASTGRSDLHVGAAGAAAGTLAVTVLAVGDALAAGLLGPLGPEAFWNLAVGDGINRWLSQMPAARESAAAALVAATTATTALVATARLASRESRKMALAISVIAGSATVTALPLALASTFDLSTVSAMAILATGASLAAGAGVVTGRRDEVWGPSIAAALLATAGLLLIPAGGWARATEAGTIALLAVALLVSVASLVAASPGLRLGLPLAPQTIGAIAASSFIGLAAAIAGASSDTLSHAGLAAAVAAAAALVVAAQVRRHHPEGPISERIAVAGALLGLVAASADRLPLAVALTICVPAAALAGASDDRRVYRSSAALLAGAAAWAWLDLAGVVVVEAYSLTAALAAFGAGMVHEGSNRRTSSWQAMAPGLLLALGPSLAVALTEGGTARPAILAIASVIVVAIGARTHQQAPLVIGAGVLLVLAVDTLGPVAAALPRWLTIGAAGALLLWMGATADRRLEQVRRARARFDELEGGTRATVRAIHR